MVYQDCTGLGPKQAIIGRLFAASVGDAIGAPSTARPRAAAFVGFELCVVSSSCAFFHSGLGVAAVPRRPDLGFD